MVTNTSKALLAKVDPQGNIIWEKTYGEGSNNYALYFEESSDGGFIILGMKAPFEDPTYEPIDNFYWLIKTDSQGNLLWQESFEGEGYRQASSVHETSDGGFLMIGTMAISGEGGVWLNKVNAEGMLEWENLIGETGWNYAQLIAQADEGGYVFLGSTIDEGMPQENWILELDAHGEVVSRTLFSQEEFEFFYNIPMLLTSDGGYLFLSGFASGQEFTIVKTDADMEYLWEMAIETDLYPHSYIQCSADGGYAFAGSSPAGHDYTKATFLKTDSEGNIEFERDFEGVSSFESVEQTQDGGYLLAGYNESGTWLVKTDAEGNVMKEQSW